MTTARSLVRGVLMDLDGVIRLWRDVGSRHAETACNLPPGTIAHMAYGRGRDLAHHGLLSHEAWVAHVRDRLVAEFGASAAQAADLWAADRGEIDQSMIDVVRWLRAAGLRVAALTNNTSILVHDLVLHKIDDLFDAVINSADIGVCKPAPAAFRIAAAHLCLPLRAIAFADDDPTNVEAAAVLGMHAHLHTSTESFIDYLAVLGVDPHHDRTRPPPAAHPPRRGAAAPLIDRVLAVLGSPAAPPDAAAESDTHSPTYRVRYLATALTPGQLAHYLSGHNEVIATAADGGRSVGLILADGTTAEVRLLPAGADARLAAGDPAAWIPDCTTIGAEVEHLPTWTSDTRRQASHPLHHGATRCAWHLTQLAAAHGRGDPLAAAAALDRARVAVVSIAAMLARHQPIPTTGTMVGRYLKPGTTTRLAASWRADPTTPHGLAEATSAVVATLQHVRYAAQHVLDTELPWPWDQLTATLRPLLGDQADLTPRAAHDDVLYGTELAAVYDQHRPIPPQMAAGLRAIGRRWLHHAVVLELGAGTGRVTAHLADDADRYLAVEYSPAMAHKLAARELPNLTTILGDVHHLDIDDGSVDVVIEHETLPFTDVPTKVIDEVQRILRPGGLLLRILVHPVGHDPGTAVEAAYRKAAFATGPGPLFTGKGTDPLLNAMLAKRGWITHEHTFAVWQHARTVRDVLAPLADKAWPYLHQATPGQHAAGMAAAQRAAVDAAGTEGVLTCTHRLYALVTTIGGHS